MRPLLSFLSTERLISLAQLLQPIYHFQRNQYTAWKLWLEKVNYKNESKWEMVQEELAETYQEIMEILEAKGIVERTSFTDNGLESLNSIEHGLILEAPKFAFGKKDGYRYFVVQEFKLLPDGTHEAVKTLGKYFKPEEASAKKKQMQEENPGKIFDIVIQIL